MENLVIRPVREAEFAAWNGAIADAQGRDADEIDLDVARRVVNLERSLGAFDRGIPVAGASLQTREMTLPGGDRVDVAGLLWCGVAPTHRRRGIFTELMRTQLTELYEYRREPLAVMRSSDSTVPNKFGYGTTTQALVLEGDTRRMTFRDDVRLGPGRVVLLDVEHARPYMERIYEQARRMHVGWVERDQLHWDIFLADAATRGASLTKGRIAVNLDDDDQPLGYAIYRYERRQDAEGRDTSKLHVLELVASKMGAYTRLWRFLLDLDGATCVVADCAADEPLQHMLVNSRAVQWSLVDRLALRLVDMPRALGLRRYACDFDVTMLVRDPFCDWNDGIFRVQGNQHGADCARGRGNVDLELSVVDLAAAYLGGTSLMSLALAGRIQVHSPVALQTMTTAFKGFREPTCAQGKYWPLY